MTQKQYEYKKRHLILHCMEHHNMSYDRAKKIADEKIKHSIVTTEFNSLKARYDYYNDKLSRVWRGLGF